MIQSRVLYLIIIAIYTLSSNLFAQQIEDAPQPVSAEKMETIDTGPQKKIAEEEVNLGAIEAAVRIINDMVFEPESLKIHSVEILADTTLDSIAWYLAYSEFDAMHSDGKMKLTKFYITYRVKNEDYETPVVDKKKGIRQCGLSREECISKLQEVNGWPGIMIESEEPEKQ